MNEFYLNKTQFALKAYFLRFYGKISTIMTSRTYMNLPFNYFKTRPNSGEKKTE